MQMLRMELFKEVSLLHCFSWSQGKISDDWKGAKLSLVWEPLKNLPHDCKHLKIKKLKIIFSFICSQRSEVKIFQWTSAGLFRVNVEDTFSWMRWLGFPMLYMVYKWKLFCQLKRQGSLSFSWNTGKQSMFVRWETEWEWSKVVPKFRLALSVVFIDPAFTLMDVEWIGQPSASEGC